MKIVLNFLLVLVLGISLISVSACNDRSHILQGGNGGGDGHGDGGLEKPTEVPPHYQPDQFIEGSSFKLSETVEEFAHGKWVGKSTCFLWKMKGLEKDVVKLEATKYIGCGENPVDPSRWERIIEFDAKSGTVLIDEVRVGENTRNGDLFDKKIFFYFFANDQEKALFDTFEALKVESQAYPAFTINNVSYLNAPGTSLHGLLLQRTDVAANKKQRVKWSLLKLINLSPK